MIIQTEILKRPNNGRLAAVWCEAFIDLKADPPRRWWVEEDEGIYVVFDSGDSETLRMTPGALHAAVLATEKSERLGI